MDGLLPDDPFVGVIGMWLVLMAGLTLGVLLLLLTDDR